MMVLVLTSGALSVGIGPNAICLKSEPGRKRAKRSATAARSPSYSQAFLVNLARHATNPISRDR
jgi:hypothetical protein